MVLTGVPNFNQTAHAEAIEGWYGDSEISSSIITSSSAITFSAISAIGTARGVADGTEVTVEGAVTRVTRLHQTDGNDAFGYVVWVQDNTGGLAVPVGKTLPAYEIGQTLTVTGTKGTANGEIRINDSTIVVSDAPLAPVNPDQVTIAAFKANPENYYGKLIKFQGVEVKTRATAANHTIADGSEDLTFRVPFNRGHLGPNHQVGSTLNVVGVATAYNTTPQIIISSFDDIAVVSQPAAPSVTHTIKQVRDLNAAGQSVATKGVVTAITRTSTNDASTDHVVWIQDATAGIALFYTGNVTPPYEIGQELTVSGSTAITSGEFRINIPLTVHGDPSSLAPRTPDVVLLADFEANPANYYGKLIKLENVELKTRDSSASHKITNGTVDLTLRVPFNGGSLPSEYTVGSTLDVTGVATAYNTTVQLMIADLADVELKVQAPPSVITTIPVADARSMPVGSSVAVRGVVSRLTNSSASNMTNATVWIQDGTAGIAAYRSGNTIAAYQPGQEVIVTGTTSVFQNALQIGSGVEITPTGAQLAPITPETVTLADFVANPEDYYGELIKLEGVKLKTRASLNQIVTDDTTDLILATPFDGGSLPSEYTVGSTLDVTGIANVASGGIQIRVSDIADVELKVQAPPPVINTISIADARELEPGTTVAVKGVVSRLTQSSPTNTTNATVWIQDATAGISVYKSGNTITTYQPGQEVIVTGAIGVNYGTIQISGSVEIMRTDTPIAPITPQIITLDQYFENTQDYLGELITIEYAEIINIEATGANHTIADDWGRNIGMRLPTQTSLPATHELGAIVHVTGVANNATQILVSTIADIEVQNILVSHVVPTPATNSTVLLNSEVELETRTADADIFYTLNGGSEQRYTGPIGITAFDQDGNATIVAYAKKGADESRRRTFVYTQTKVGTVAASVPSGAIVPGRAVALSTTTDDAQIMYHLDTNVPSALAMLFAEDESLEELEEEEVEAKTAERTQRVIGLLDAGRQFEAYTEPIVITEDMFPVVITAYATAVGYLDSDEVAFSYTHRVTGNERNYFGQLHSHTLNSDGIGTLDEAFAYARDDANLDFFAVTDHSNYWDNASSDPAGVYNLREYQSANPRWQDGVVAARNANRPGEFVSFYGFEMTWSGGPGHINTFATEGFVSRNNSVLNAKGNDAGLRAYYELLKETPESISQFNHPGPTFGNFANFAYWDPTIDERITLLEVGNGEGAIGSGGYFPSYRELDLALDKGWHVAPTNNQDNHRGRWGNSNTARTVIHTNDLSINGVYQALREKRVYATEDNDLDIVYTLNGEILGTVLDEVPSEAHFQVEVKNPDESKRVRDISIITNGGRTIYTAPYGTRNATLDHKITNPSAGYYYIKVVQESGRIAVTAPIWLGSVPVVGINSISTETFMPVTDEELTIVTELFNNELGNVTLQNISYDISGDQNGTLSTKQKNIDIASGGTYQDTFNFTPSVAGESIIRVTANILVGGVTRTYTDELPIGVWDNEGLVYIGIDASHANEYVSGNYKDSMTNFGKLAATYGVRTVQLNTQEELLAAMQNDRYKMMVFTAPSRRITPAADHKFYSAAVASAVADFARSGKTLVFSGWSDTYENYSGVLAGLDNHMAGQQNSLLNAIGSTLRIADDASLDNDNNGGQAPRLYLTDYNDFVSPLLRGVVYVEDGEPEVDTQVYSHYGGATIYAVGNDGVLPVSALPSSVIPIISGHATTFSSDSDRDGFGLPDPTMTIPRYGNRPAQGIHPAGRVLVTASETITHSNGQTSEVVVSGAAFMSNFEIQATVDNASSLNYSNYNLLSNLIATIAPEPTVTNIADITDDLMGRRVTIEGIATSNVHANTADLNTGFFDTIYIQDATGGINLHPVAEGVIAGQKIRVTGRVSAFQGEIQVSVTSVTVLGATITEVTPLVLTTKQSMLPENRGMFIKTAGFVKEIFTSGDLITQVIIDDGSGEARVFINSYITTSKTLPFVEKGAYISVLGLASIGEVMDSEDPAPRIRVRDRAEIALATPPQASPTPAPPLITPGPGQTPSPSSTSRPSSTSTPAPTSTTALSSTPTPSERAAVLAERVQNAERLQEQNQEVIESIILRITESVNNVADRVAQLVLDEATSVVSINNESVASLIEAEVSLQVKSGETSITINPEILSEIAGDGESVAVSMETLSAEETTELLASIQSNSSREFTPIGDILDIKILANGQEVTNFNSFLDISVDLSDKGLLTHEVRKMTGARFVSNGTILLGGSYNQTSRTFEFATDQLSRYGVITMDDLVNLILSIDNSNYTINGLSETFDTAPIIEKDRMMVPVRLIAESFGADVSWNESTRTVTIQLDGGTLMLTIDELIAGMDVPARLYNDRTMVPIRYVSESLGANVIYREQTKTVNIVK